MELPFKFVAISVFVHATESEEKVKGVMESLLPEEVEIEKSKAKGHHGDPIVILKARIDRRPFLRKFWCRVIEKLQKNEKEKLTQYMRDRIGDDCRLYLRFDKQLAVSDELALVDSGDALHVRINISAYPAKREIAIEKMEKFIASGWDKVENWK
ncbi:hypothetical protein AKJ45_00610 [candidate division MSBL1 archaeon SCGC-AAA261F19]|uniref:Exosome subunit n=1 Tax=candidate division MSBL1 archaeon SCGC-AAA261F19 TaxID=1698275 RepID=A0A133VBD8_9EURY|nr:hypothetical protein AKJ45_00610 [candidate division MSBL1 archaeon SCGC-AAA261F19]